MAKNCWEIKNCGRQPGGDNVTSMGVCPAASDSPADGLNHGSMGGRICWAVGGTFCGGKVQGTFAEKKLSCLSCDVMKMVRAEEGAAFVLLKPEQQHRSRVA